MRTYVLGPSSTGLQAIAVLRGSEEVPSPIRQTAETAELDWIYSGIYGSVMAHCAFIPTEFGAGLKATLVSIHSLAEESLVQRLSWQGDAGVFGAGNAISSWRQDPLLPSQGRWGCHSLQAKSAPWAAS